MTVTAPPRPSAMPALRARRRWNDESANVDRQRTQAERILDASVLGGLLRLLMAGARVVLFGKTIRKLHRNARLPLPPPLRR
jgi:hypothetical protein